MGKSNSRPVHNRPKRSENGQRSTEGEYEIDDRSIGGATKVVSFQDQFCSKRDKKGRGNSDINLQDRRHNRAPDYATLPPYAATSTPVYMNEANRTRCAATSVSNEASASAITCQNEYEVFPPITYDNHQERSSSGVYVGLPQLPESAGTEKEKPPVEEYQESVRYGTVLNRDRSSGYRTTSCFLSPDTAQNQPYHVFINQRVIDDSEIKESERFLRDGVVHKERDEGTSHATVVPCTDRDGDAANRDEEKKPSTDNDYEPVPDKCSLQRAGSYKTGHLVMIETQRTFNQPKTPVANLRPSTHHPMKALTTNGSEPQPLQHLQPQLAQPLHTSLPQLAQPLHAPFTQLSQPMHTPLPQPSQHPPPLSIDQTRDDQVHYRVGLGSELRVPQMTINVPGDLGSGLTHVGFRWGSHSNEFPVLSADEKPLTNVLHCLPRGSIFSSPVLVALDLPSNVGQIDVIYTPTGEGENPAWKRLRFADAGTGSARLTDGQEPFKNKALLLKNGRKVVLVLHHFSSFVVVENGSCVTRPRKAEVAIFLKTRCTGQQSWSAILKVVVGCDENNAKRRHKSLKGVGYRMIEREELLLYRSQSGSGLEVGIRDVEWTVGCTQKQSKTRMTHSLDCLWSGMEATSQFWVTSKGSKQNEEQLTMTVFIRQQGRLEKPIGIYCDMIPSDLRTLSKSRRTVSATRSSPALFGPVKRPYESDATDPNSDSDLGLVTEDLSSHRRHDNVRSDSEPDFELNYCATRKRSLTAEDLSDHDTLSKRFSCAVDSMEHFGKSKHYPVPPIGKGRLGYSPDDVVRITSTIGGTAIAQPDLKWMFV